MHFSFARILAAFLLVGSHPAAFAAGTEKPVPMYYSQVTIEVTPGGKDAERAIRGHLPKNDRSITVSRVRNTGLFEMGVTAADPRVAAQRANEAAVTLRAALLRDENPRELKIWEKAEPALKPMTPAKDER